MGVLVTVAVLLIGVNASTLFKPQQEKNPEISLETEEDQPETEFGTTTVKKETFTYKVLAYGKNDHGQMSGKKFDDVIHSEILITSSLPIIRTYAGKSHTLAITKDKEVMSWGDNMFGQLGYKTSGTTSGTPKKIEGLENIVSLSSSNNHTMALDADGNVYTWGSNYTGQIGDNSHQNRYSPFKVPGLPKIKQISAGHKFSLALDTNGNLWGWGASCETGNVAKAKALLDSVGSTMTDLDGGYYDNSSSGGTTYDPTQDCLNENIIDIKSVVPRKLPATNIKEVSSGYGHALLLTNSGTVQAFGCNFYGQVGYPARTKKEDGRWLTTIVGLPKIVSVTAGSRHSLAIDVDGNVWGWGANGAGQLGYGVNRHKAEKIIGLPPIKTVYSSFDYNIAIAKDGATWIWGGNTAGLLVSDLPVKADYVIKTSTKNTTHVATGGMHILFETK